MNVYMIIYLGGAVLGSVGPLPPEEFQWCQQQAYQANANRENDDRFANEERDHVVYYCQFRNDRPRSER